MTENLKALSKKNNIILIGFMASGKSCIGRLLAREIGWDHLDTDSEIEKVTGLRIPELFRKYGELRFRSEESLVVKKLCGVTRTVISTGGGTVIQADNFSSLDQIGLMIHLFVPLETALKRIKRRQDRPLLLKSENEIQMIYRERLDIYNRADFTIDTTDKELDTIVAEIVSKMKGGCFGNASKN